MRTVDESLFVAKHQHYDAFLKLFWFVSFEKLKRKYFVLNSNKYFQTAYHFTLISSKNFYDCILKYFSQII